MNQSQANRIKNILDGDFTSKASTSIGFEKESKEHSEDEIFEENGKFFTIKDGIKCSYSKLSKFRKLNSMPLVCPVCGNIMKTKLDKVMWGKKQKCFNCVVDEDTQLIIRGEWQEYSKEIIDKNIISFLNDFKQMFPELLLNLESKHFITECGDIESWDGGTIDKEKLKIKFEESVEKLTRTLKDGKEK